MLLRERMSLNMLSVYFSAASSRDNQAFTQSIGVSPAFAVDNTLLTSKRWCA